MGDEKPGAVRFLTDFSAGSRIAGYCLEEQIGHGGTAVVFRAQDERLPRQVALKILSPALTTDDEFRHRFIRESRSAAAVDDPHIIPVYEAGDANGVTSSPPICSWIRGPAGPITCTCPTSG
jgi:serine/threonine protein kinase